MTAIEKATYIYSTLVENGGKIERSKENKDLFQYYYEPETKEYLNILTNSLKLGTFAGDNAIYLFPKNNSIFAYKENDVKMAIPGIKTNAQVYLTYIILLVFIVETYGGENVFNKTSYYVSKDRLLEKVDELFKSISDQDESDDNEIGLNFHAAALCWNSLLSDTTGNKNSITNKPGFIHKAMLFFENKASLIFKDEETGETHYLPTMKLEDFVKSGNFDKDRFDEVKDFINKKGEKENA